MFWHKIQIFIGLSAILVHAEIREHGGLVTVSTYSLISIISTLFQKMEIFLFKYPVISKPQEQIIVPFFIISTLFINSTLNSP